ncbi:PDxFFG protein [Mycoplasma marinum]|uniref:PDxFFG protein n=1 Tax=Mycoplasma marinum TaxID=1937190 RepID=A0A4R0XV68_9MOLU|nr:PDxFFG protein [Mycoplasma marinum]TCG11730.1 PDxFFG protein [Mycoplasma marinum]
MKLWMKSLLAMGVIGGTTGAAIGASYAFVKIDPSEQGYQYKSRFSKYTNIDKSNVTGLKARVVKHGGDFFDDKIAEIDLVKKQVEGKNIDDYFTEYASKHKGNSPDFVIHVGSMTFDNQYTTAIKPSEFIDFIKWFFKNVSWGPEISTLTSFSIIRGVEINGNTVTLGGHTSKRHETTNIKFYPDAFFGSLPMYTTITGPGSKPDSMLAKFGNASTLEDINRVVKNIAPLFDKAMKKNVQDNIGKKFGDITVNKEDVKNANYKFEKHLYPIGKFLVNGKHVEKYQTYTHINPELYSAIAKKYPYHLKETTGPVIERNSKGEYKIVTKKHKYMPISERIPMPEILSLNPKFKGIGSSWLHYVATHEYGHHQTLDAANDQSGKNVLLGAWQKINSPSFDGSAYNIKNVNLYLKARANGLQVRRVAASEAEKSKRDIKNYKEGIYAKFSTDNGKSFETNKQIFGTEKEDWIEINKEGGEDKEWLFKKYAKVLEFAQNYPPFAKQLQPSWRVFHPTKPSDWDKYPSLLDLISNSSNMPIILNNITLPPKTPSKKNIDTRALVTKKVLGKIYNGQPYKGYLLNAFDNNSGTLSEDIDAPAEVLSNGHYIKANDLPINPNWNKEELKIWNDMPLDYNLSGYNYINLDGKKTIDSAIAKQGRGKFTSDDIKSIFTDYTMTFPLHIYQVKNH